MCVLLCVSVNYIVACKNNTKTSKPNTQIAQEVQTDENLALLDGATTLATNGDYYESNALQITQGTKYAFKLVNNVLGHNVSTLYMYNAKKRMGNAFLDGTTEKQNLSSAYWSIRVYDSDKHYIDFATLHPLTSQMSWSDSWDDVYEFKQNKTYYLVLDILKTKSGNWYFSVY